jgi:hypothetical protein
MTTAPRAGVLCDVVERLLPNPVQRLLDRGDRLRLVYGVHGDGKLVPGSHRRNLPLERGHQPFLAEEFRPQLEDQRSHLGKSGLGQGLRIPKDCVEPGLVGATDALGGCDLEHDRIEGLLHRVVEIASY